MPGTEKDVVQNLWPPIQGEIVFFFVNLAPNILFLVSKGGMI